MLPLATNKVIGSSSNQPWASRRLKAAKLVEGHRKNQDASSSSYWRRGCCSAGTGQTLMVQLEDPVDATAETKGTVVPCPQKASRS